VSGDRVPTQETSSISYLPSSIFLTVDWDFFLLGLVTGIAGILGLPFPNGLIPQAPFHTESLCVVRTRADPDEKNKEKQVVYVERVVEQRVTNLSQGLLILLTMSPPLLHVLGLIPQGVLAGLFFVMGVYSSECYAEYSYKESKGME